VLNDPRGTADYDTLGVRLLDVRRRPGANDEIASAMRSGKT
jgi:hypothetical protein